MNKRFFRNTIKISAMFLIVIALFSCSSEEKNISSTSTAPYKTIIPLREKEQLNEKNNTYFEEYLPQIENEKSNQKSLEKMEEKEYVDIISENYKRKFTIPTDWYLMNSDEYLKRGGVNQYNESADKADVICAIYMFHPDKGKKNQLNSNLSITALKERDKSYRMNATRSNRSFQKVKDQITQQGVSMGTIKPPSEIFINSDLHNISMIEVNMGEHTTTMVMLEGIWNAHPVNINMVYGDNQARQVLIDILNSFEIIK